MVDSDEDIRRKIRKAYCPARQVQGNPVLEIARYVLFARDGFILRVERPSRYGGPVEYVSYEELERDYAEGRLHPLDLKNAVAESLVEIVRPIREAVLSDSTMRRALEVIEGRVTR